MTFTLEEYVEVLVSFEEFVEVSITSGEFVEMTFTVVESEVLLKVESLLV
jgi:hypothetical protein